MRMWIVEYGVAQIITIHKFVGVMARYIDCYESSDIFEKKILETYV